MFRKSVICFGCGDFGKYFVEVYGSYIAIECFLDNSPSTEGTFLGYKRFIPSKEKCKDKFIIVTNIKHYPEIMRQLEAYGLIENKDFISIQEFEKSYPTIRTDFRTVKCWFVDFWKGFNPYDNVFTQLLRKDYNVVLDERDPDFIFCSVCGEKRKAFLYHCPRIFYTGENLIPDFNVYDYAIGFAYMDFGDRYIRWPLYQFYPEYEIAKKKHINYDIEEFMTRSFCCRVVSASDCTYREKLFDEINKRKHVASGGRCKNNLPGGGYVRNKLKFLSKYKFDLSVENSNTCGYVTEKIVQAWAAGCIPVYWGSSGAIKQEFNKAAFIDCNDFSTVSDVAEYLMELENNKDVLEKILREPILLDVSGQNDGRLRKFLKNIFDKPDEEKIQRLSNVSRCAKAHEQMYIPTQNA